MNERLFAPSVGRPFGSGQAAAAEPPPLSSPRPGVAERAYCRQRGIPRLKKNLDGLRLEKNFQ